MDWKQPGRRDSPASHGDKCAATTLTETKCEQICTRKREITFAHLNPPVSSPLPKRALTFCMTTCKRNICVYMYTERKVEGGEEKKKEIKEKMWQGDLQLRPNVCSAARAEAATVSVLSIRSVSTGRVAGRREEGDASEWLYDSCYQV